MPKKNGPTWLFFLYLTFGSWKSQTFKTYNFVGEFFCLQMPIILPIFCLFIFGADNMVSFPFCIEPVVINIIWQTFIMSTICSTFYFSKSCKSLTNIQLYKIIPCSLYYYSIVNTILLQDASVYYWY